MRGENSSLLSGLRRKHTEVNIPQDSFSFRLDSSLSFQNARNEQKYPPLSEPVLPSISIMGGNSSLFSGLTTQHNEVNIPQDRFLSRLNSPQSFQNTRNEQNYPESDTFSVVFDSERKEPARPRKRRLDNESVGENSSSATSVMTANNILSSRPLTEPVAVPSIGVYQLSDSMADSTTSRGYFPYRNPMNEGRAGRLTIGSRIRLRWPPTNSWSNGEVIAIFDDDLYQVTFDDDDENRGAMIYSLKNYDFHII